jgi:hypothetical protein
MLALMLFIRVAMTCAGHGITSELRFHVRRKFKSAAEKAAYEANAKSWELLLDKYKPKKIKDERKDLSSVYSLSVPAGRDVPAIPSRVTPGGSTSARVNLKYTGDKIVGVGTLHKSNMVPVFSDEEAKDLSNMRR